MGMSPATRGEFGAGAAAPTFPLLLLLWGRVREGRVRALVAAAGPVRGLAGRLAGRLVLAAGGRVGGRPVPGGAAGACL